MNLQAVKNIQEIELAGCLDITNSKGNFGTIVHRLELLLSLRYTKLKSAAIVSQIEAEAEECFLPYHEYVVNELQYEYRFSSKLKFSEKYENQVLSKWIKMIVLRYNVAIADEFLGVIKINRDSRKR